jgi:GntR family transcriptional regulator, vanillate catabolism transcriptional regulator
MGVWRVGAATQSDRALLLLRELLLTGAFAPGDRLTELGLVPRLGASRTPVRQALLRLAHEGLLETIPAGGFRVRAFTLEEIWDAIEIRGVLEGTAARLAAERLRSVAELNGIRGLVAALEEVVPVTVESFVRYLELNEAFHRELRQLAKSPVLLRTIEGVMTLPFAAPGALVFHHGESTHAARTAVIAQEHHRAIVEAIEHGEGARAESLAREHSRVARRNLTRALADQDLFRRMPGASLIKRTAG